MERIALVTGGTKGIGAASAIALKKAGYKVIVTYYNDHLTANQFLSETAIYGYCCDINDPAACQKTAVKIVEDLGPIDVLVNNAGIISDAFFHKMTSEQWQKVINTNLIALYNMTHLVVQGMRNRNFGRIINVSSVNGLQGQVGQTNYAASKAGIIGFTKALALENATKNITVNAIAPGYIETTMTKDINQNILKKITDSIPMGRLGTPQEIAYAVVFLASDYASYITGATLNINGGQYLA